MTSSSPTKALPFDEAKITSMLRTGKLDDARAYLASVIETTVGAENDAAVFVQYARAYMQVMNSINRRYLESLQRAQKLASSLNEGRAHTDELFRIAELKADL